MSENQHTTSQPSISPESTNNRDMASAANALRPFAGREDEDPTEWLKEVTLVSRLFNFNEETTARLMLLKLTGQAQSWASSFIGGDMPIVYDDVVRGLCERFMNTARTHKILEKFLGSGVPDSRERYLENLRDANLLLDKGCLNVKSLMKLVIARSPEALKGTLYQSACNSRGEWQVFMKTAEDSIWLAYPESNLQVIAQNPVKTNFDYKKKNFTKKKH